MKFGNTEIINVSAIDLKHAVDKTRKLIKDSKSPFNIHLIIEPEPSIGYNERVYSLLFACYTMAVVNDDQDLLKRIKHKEIIGEGFLISIDPT